MKFPLFIISFLLPLSLLAQNPDKKKMDHSVFEMWSKIENVHISNNGLWISYELAIEDNDSRQCVYDVTLDQTYTFARGKGGKISADNQFLVFQTHPPVDSVREMKRRKVKKEDLPVPTLVIYNLENKQIDSIQRVTSFSLAEKWSDALIYQMAPALPDTTLADSIKIKKENEDNGHRLVIRDLENGQEKVIPYVINFVTAEDAPRLLLTCTGDEEDLAPGVYFYDCKEKNWQSLFSGKGVFKKLALDKEGQQAAFLANLDTTKSEVKPYQLYHWSGRNLPAISLANPYASFLPKDWNISENGRIYFSENSQRLFFGIAPPPILQDTSLLEEEIVNVEVWHYQDKRTYPQQKIELEEDQKKTYEVVYHFREKKFIPIGQPDIPEVTIGDEGNATFAIGENEMPYLETISWEGFPSYKDLYWINLKDGSSQPIAKKVRGQIRLSPAGNYPYWYSTPDSSWMVYSSNDQKIHRVHQKVEVPFYNELFDQPNHPYPYGIAGWTEKDQALLLYDRYDIWKVDPKGQKNPERITQGRENKTVFRYLKVDPEERSIDLKKEALIHAHNETDKSEALYFLNWSTGKMTLQVEGDFAFAKKVIKAKDANQWILRKENFQVYPDLLLAQNGNFARAKKISSANPQQKDYSWGTIELYHWTASDGQSIQGLLVKPENFDPKKKYPLLVNFYERSSQRLHRHRSPYPGRSTINYSYYANKGYVIFNPDVPYRVGYPGESAENAVLSGVSSLIGEGFIDKDRIGVQGHSWGGYQVAHLLTKTDIFRCAESGAPVVNMFSAYGGIRWRSGLSRMFQYEHTQSRIGGTIWEYPLRYLENSPVFSLDKVNTPVLILHNDKDGAVPWYQGIEYFMGLRRLGKPAWMLNYQGEPHWPVKRHNRLDFNLRMEQFFDYYLMDAPMPQWMQRGVPAVELGILQGLEVGK